MKHFSVLAKAFLTSRRPSREGRRKCTPTRGARIGGAATRLQRAKLAAVMGRTFAISGSRPSANHTDRFYRESAALLSSAL